MKFSDDPCLPCSVSKVRIQNQTRPKINNFLRSLAPLTSPAVPYSNAGKEAKVLSGSEGKEDNIMLWTNASVFPDFCQLIYVARRENKKGLVLAFTIQP